MTLTTVPRQCIYLALGNSSPGSAPSEKVHISTAVDKQTNVRVFDELGNVFIDSYGVDKQWCERSLASAR